MSLLHGEPNSLSALRRSSDDEWLLELHACPELADVFDDKTPGERHCLVRFGELRKRAKEESHRLVR